MNTHTTKLTAVLLLLLAMLQPVVAQDEPDPDVLLGSVTVGMSRADVEAQAEEQEWTRTKRTATSLTYTSGTASQARMGTFMFTFKSGVVRSVDVTFNFSAPQLRTLGPRILERARQAFIERAETVVEKGNQTICTRSASDGSTVRATWTGTGQSTARVHILVIPQ